MDFKGFLSEETINVEFVEPDKRSRTIVLKLDGNNPDYIVMTTVDGKNKITFHKSGAKKIIAALEKISK